jgi:hypothetical protein
MMVRKLIAAGALVTALGLSLPAHAQGVPGGAAYGATRGGEAAGPVGAVVGGVVGGVIGGVEGVLGIEHRVSYATPEVPAGRDHRLMHRRHAHSVHHRRRTGAA